MRAITCGAICVALILTCLPAVAQQAGHQVRTGDTIIVEVPECPDVKALISKVETNQILIDAFNRAVKAEAEEQTAKLLWLDTGLTLEDCVLLIWMMGMLIVFLIFLMIIVCRGKRSKTY